MTESLPDEYLGNNFPWAFVVDLPDANYYLKYSGTKLWPMTKVRVNLRNYGQVQNGVPYQSTYYEQLWYYYHKSAGLRRYNQIAIPAQTSGAIIVCPGDGSADPLQRPLAISDTLVRLAADIALRNAATSLVLVPAEDYQFIVEGLAQYKFLPRSPAVPVQSIGIHLRAYPEGNDEYFYLQKQ